MPSTTDPLSEARIQALARTYRVNLDVTSAAGTIGLRQGRETGASVEIQDFRDYVPGDDPRRIDWLAYGRTDRLVVRLFREEVSPFFDLLVDASASMAIADGRKHALCLDLCRYLYHSARAEGIAARVFSAGETLQRLEGPDQLSFGAAESVLFTAPASAAAGLRRSSVRVLITDFMDPAEPSAVLRALSAGCARLLVLHVMGPWESDPGVEGPAMLHSVEGGMDLDVNLNARTVEAYRRKLAALLAVIEEESFKCGALYVRLTADRDLESVLREEFVPRGLVDVY